MNLFNSLGFFILGLAMVVLPELAPALAPANSPFGDTAMLWLEFMGGVIFLIGSGYTAKGLAAALPKPAARGEEQVPAGVRPRPREAIPADGEQAAV